MFKKNNHILMRVYNMHKIDDNGESNRYKQMKMEITNIKMNNNKTIISSKKNK